MQENQLLRERKEEFLKFEHTTHNQLQSHPSAASPPRSAADHAAASPLPEANPSRLSLDLRMRQPMTVTECHLLAQSVYTEVKAFMANKHLVTTGMSAFGWSDLRNVEDGQLKFSLQKVFPHKTARELMARTWPVVSSPATYERLYSSSMNMRCELVQQVDANNVLIYQQYYIRERDPVTQQDRMAVMRSLLLNTLFETELGYVVLSNAMDPTRLVDWPEAAGPSPDGMPVRYDSLPGFTWCSFERDGLDACKVCHVATQRTSRPHWAIEVLMLMVRWERGAMGPMRMLPSE